MAGVDFLLGNDLEGGRVWVPTPTSCGAREESRELVPDYIEIVTQCQTCRMTNDVAATRGVDCRMAGPAQAECSLVTAAPGADYITSGSPLMENSGFI